MEMLVIGMVSLGVPSLLAATLFVIWRTGANKVWAYRALLLFAVVYPPLLRVFVYRELPPWLVGAMVLGGVAYVVLGWRLRIRDSWHSRN